MNSDPEGELIQRLLTIQRGFLASIEKFQNDTRESHQQSDRLLMGLIDVIDLCDGISAEDSSDSGRVVRKIHRRLTALLTSFGVSEINISGNELKPGLVRVLESRGEKTVQVCRRGYIRQDRVLRPAEVIT